MANEKNVATLADLMDTWCREFHDMACGCDPKRDAEWLAARGVLVPSALTDEEVSVLRTCGCVLRAEIHEPVTPVAVRFVLDAIAKGEPVAWTGESYPVRLHSE